MPIRINIIPTTTLKPTISLRRMGHRSMTTSMSWGNPRWAKLPDAVCVSGASILQNLPISGRQVQGKQPQISARRRKSPAPPSRCTPSAQTRSRRTSPLECPVHVLDAAQVPSRNAIRLAMRTVPPGPVPAVEAVELRRHSSGRRQKCRIPTGQRLGSAATAGSGDRSLSRSGWGGQSAMSQETTLLPKTSACRSNRRERYPKTNQKYSPKRDQQHAPLDHLAENRKRPRALARPAARSRD